MVNYGEEQLCFVVYVQRVEIYLFHFIVEARVFSSFTSDLTKEFLLLCESNWSDIRNLYKATSNNLSESKRSNKEGKKLLFLV